MRLSEIKPIPALVDILTLAGVTDVIYGGDKPTSGLPASYIEIMQNGSYKSSASQMGIVEGVLLLSINVKLMSTGAVNTAKEDIVLGKFDSLFENNKKLSSGAYHYELDLTNLVYSGRGISEGYSTKVINLLVKIY
jgi:hypothetical protein